MQNNPSQYEQKYQEKELLGRGNYGSAYIVQSNFNGKAYVAKKMNIDGMPEAEIQAAKGQIEILQKFSDTNLYPFIVKYVQCFIYDKTIIIVMQLCEHGDLANFLKHVKKKQELLDQKVILSWFIMLVMGIQALHSKSVLHRDLKSANIFLTSNKFVKIGDFGISKVLDATSAKTFVGTPYYLSPQVCSNKKYDFKSDLWSLGCILYELCTLSYPFQANNILSLAMKITTEEVAPIPKKYSPQLNDIVMGLLTKDQTKRKSLEQILKMPYMEKFMNENGNNIDKICESIPLKRIKTQTSNVGTSSLKVSQSGGASTAEDTMKTIQSNFQMTKRDNNFGTSTKGADTLNFSLTNEMSPKQKMKLRKQQQIRKEQQKMKQAARDKLKEMNVAKSMKIQELGGSIVDKKKTARQMARIIQEENRQAAQEKKRVKHGLADNQSIDLSELCQLTNRMKTLGMTTKNLTDSQLEATIKKDQTMRNYVEPIKQEVVTQQQEELEQYYDDDFEDYIPQDDQKNNAKSQIEAVSVFVGIISGNTEGISPSKKKNVEKVFQKQQIVPKTDAQKMQDCISECIQIVGKQRYNLLYEMVSQSYNSGSFKETPQLKALRFQGSKSQKHVLRLIDQIKYFEDMI